LFAIAVLPLALYAALAANSRPDLRGIAERTAHELDRLIQLRQQQVFTISAFPSIRAFAATSPETRSQRAAVALNELQAWVASDTNVREAFVVDANGVVIMTTFEGWNQDLAARQFVQDALAGQLAVSPVAQDRGEFSNFYASPVLNNEQNIAGALVIRVAAQEMWGVTPRGDDWYAVVSDENGVRLDDSGDPARRLVSFAPPDTATASKIARAQTYGAQLPRVGATALTRAQELLEQGALDRLTPGDFDADGVAARRLSSKPWTVLIVAPRPTLPQLLARDALPLLAVVVLALGGAFLLDRIA
jgi:C4-dicarboxylate-specific signal transduction histidine kinase